MRRCKDECALALDMEQRSSDVAKKDAQIELEGVESAAGMRQRGQTLLMQRGL